MVEPLMSAARRSRRLRIVRATLALEDSEVGMKSAKKQVVGSPEQPMTSALFAQHARSVVAYHGERILMEIPTAIRRFSLYLLVLSVSLPVFLVALLIVLWRLGS